MPEIKLESVQIENASNEKSLQTWKSRTRMSASTLIRKKAARLVQIPGKFEPKGMIDVMLDVIKREESSMLLDV